MTDQCKTKRVVYLIYYDILRASTKITTSAIFCKLINGTPSPPLLVMWQSHVFFSHFGRLEQFTDQTLKKKQHWSREGRLLQTITDSVSRNFAQDCRYCQGFYTGYTIIYLPVDNQWIWKEMQTETTHKQTCIADTKNITTNILRCSW